MIKRTWPFGVFILTACVTVNVYFPAAAVQNAADKIVEETWGEQPNRSQQSRSQQSRRWSYEGLTHYASFLLVSDAYAQNADINISNPAIRAIKNQMRERSEQLKPFLNKKNLGINKSGYLEVLNTDGIGLRERSQVNQLVAAENRDRKALYEEIARANNLQGATQKIEQIFADTWREKAETGWQIQKNDGTWVTK